MSARARRAAAVAVLFLAPASAAASGGLDASFGQGGVAYSSSPLDGSAASGHAVAQDAQGRILVAGVASDSTASPHTAVWRLTSSGEADASFGRGGVSVSGEMGWAWGSALDGRGRLLSAGIKAVYGKASTRAVLERWNSDGSRDAGFGSSGRVEAESPYGGAVSEGAAASARDGRILLAGQAGDNARRVIPTVWLLRDDGSFDGAVSTAASRRLTVPGDVAEARVSALIPRASGGWWAAGTIAWRELALWRLKDDGSPDWDFGAGGLVLTQGVGRALVEDGAGGVWAAGFATSGIGTEKRTLAVTAHFAADGSTTSWTSFEVPSGLRDREAFALVRAADGRLFVGGDAYDGKRPVRACVWALKADGTPDSRFGADGVLVLPPVAGGEERVYGLALDAKGRLLATGISRDAKGRYRRAVWRFKTR